MVELMVDDGKGMMVFCVVRGISATGIVGKEVTPLLDSFYTTFVTALIVNIVEIVRVHIQDSKP
jgi:hypothetical protein